MQSAGGLKEATEKDFDLLIMDMLIPAMHGEEMITKLKQDENNKNKPIIVSSALVGHDTQGRVEAMGVSAFYVKTHVTPNELAKKVGEISAN
jgi:CheY-like chemotaxis protein